MPIGTPLCVFRPAVTYHPIKSPRRSAAGGLREFRQPSIKGLLTASTGQPQPPSWNSSATALLSAHPLHAHSNGNLCFAGSFTAAVKAPTDTTRTFGNTACCTRDCTKALRLGLRKCTPTHTAAQWPSIANNSLSPWRSTLQRHPLHWNVDRQSGNQLDDAIHALQLGGDGHTNATRDGSCKDPIVALYEALNWLTSGFGRGEQDIQRCPTPIHLCQEQRPPPRRRRIPSAGMDEPVDGRDCENTGHGNVGSACSSSPS